MSVRVRYAPSPTGLQHIGGVRTALFNYFFARANGGTFILRIEDTDRERYNDASLQDIYDTFAWLGIHWDEGPDVGGPHASYFQSERLSLYQEFARKLVDSGHAYYCWCTSERLEEMRKKQAETTGAQGYDRHCRNLSADDRKKLSESGQTPVIRFKVPLEGSTTFHDRLLGTIEWKNVDINPDPVLIKSDGFPTYHMANIIDDHLMEITHILRAQEWASSTPLHVLLYKAFGWTPPEYCHLPMVMGSDGKKLSKRHGATSVIEFRKAGYLPEAIINYISLLGWNPGDDREFFTKDELGKIFSLERLNKAPAVFDYKKLESFNGHYIREKSDEELASSIVPYLIREGLVADPPSADEHSIIRKSIPMIRERLHFLSDAPELIRFLFRAPDSYVTADPGILIPKKTTAAETREYLATARTVLAEVGIGDDALIEQRFREEAEKKGTKLGNLLMPLRVAVTGTTVSPPLFESIRIIGREAAFTRISAAVDSLSKAAGKE